MENSTSKTGDDEGGGGGGGSGDDEDGDREINNANRKIETSLQKLKTLNYKGRLDSDEKARLANIMNEIGTLEADCIIDDQVRGLHKTNYPGRLDSQEASFIRDIYNGKFTCLSLFIFINLN